MTAHASPWPVAAGLILLLAACGSPDTVVEPQSELTPPSDRPPLPELVVVETDAPAPSLTAADVSVVRRQTGLAALREGYRQLGDWELWDQVLPNAQLAAAALQADEADNDMTRAGTVTAQALREWHGAYIDAMQTNANDVPGLLAEPSPAALVDGIVGRLREVEGRIPHTSLLLAEVQMQSGDAEGGAATIVKAIESWPADDDVHELARAWRDAVPDPDLLLESLERAVRRTSDDEGVRARSLATSAYLNLSLGGSLYAEGDYAASADRYDRAAREFVMAYEADPDSRTLTGDDADLLGADSAINAGWARYHLAGFALDDGDEGTARDLITQAEESFGEALERVANNERAIQGLDFVGDFYVNPDRLGDQPGGRDMFGRIARRFDLAKWWNNHAFFWRETAPDPDPAVQTANYRNSYEAYERCIALETDNARYTNDTALILVHYLIETASDDELARAEELLRRAWALGKDVCENPFVDEAVYDSNFEAYGDAMYNLALLLFRQQRVSEARELIEELLAIAPGRPDARMLGAQILSVDG